MLDPPIKNAGSKKAAIGAHRFILYKRINIQIMKTKKLTPPAHHEGWEENNIDPASKPTPAGLKMCRPSSLIKNLDKTAIIPISKSVKGSSPN